MNEELVMHVDHLFEIASNNCAWLKVVAELFGCDVIALDTGISIKGSDDVIHKAEDVLKSMDSILAKKEQLDLLADTVRKSLDMAAIYRAMEEYEHG